MGRFRIQLLLLNGQWQTKYTIEKHTNYSASSTDWTVLYFDSRDAKYGIKLNYGH